MIPETPRVPRINDYVYTPPILPPHLSSVYDLKPIVGSPTDEQVKAIHAVIGAVDAGSRAVYRKNYPVNMFPGDNTYTPPSLPAYVPVELDPIVGAPSKDQLRAAQHAMRAVESLGSGPLFDSDLNMRLCQHVFNLHFAQYIQDSTYGELVPKPTGRTPAFDPPAPPNIDQGVPPEPVPTDEPVIQENPVATAIKQQEQVMKELMTESKDVLENMNRVLIAIQRNQTTIAEWDKNHIVHVNPVNDQGIPATECGLPQLRYWYMKGCYWINLNHASMAGYLKFFGLGDGLLEGDEPPRLKDPQKQADQAWQRIRKHLGFVY